MVQLEDLGNATWDDANRMCENSTIAGHTDWRLPTLDELMVIYFDVNKEIFCITHES